MISVLGMFNTIISGLRFRRSQRGAALVEYAFVVILFFVLIFGISGFGHVLYVYHAINNAAKEGTRWAAVNGKTCSDDGSCNGTNGMNNGDATAAQIQTYVTSQLPASLDPANADVSASFLAPAGSPDICANQVPSAANPAVKIGAYPNYPGCTVQVTVAYAYNFSFPFLPAVTTPTAPCSKVGYCLSSSSEIVIVH